jgi:hypothetical protein
VSVCPADHAWRIHHYSSTLVLAVGIVYGRPPLDTDLPRLVHRTSSWQTSYDFFQSIIEFWETDRTQNFLSPVLPLHVFPRPLIWDIFSHCGAHSFSISDETSAFDIQLLCLDVKYIRSCLMHTSYKGK